MTSRTSKQRNKEVQTAKRPSYFRIEIPVFLSSFLVLCLLALSMPVSVAGNAGLECKTIAQEKPGKSENQIIADLFEIEKPKQAPRLTCLSSARQIHEEWNKNKSEVLLVDVRRADEYDKYRIPGSLNLAPFALLSKSFLKQKRIVLVNDGQHLSQLQTLCDRLKKAGFRQTDVLAGGLYAWHQAGFPINGEKFELSKLNQISPAELISSLHERDWKYIDLDRSVRSLSKLLPMTDVIEYQTDKRNFISVVNRAEEEFDTQRLSGYVVISSNGNDYEKMESLLQLTNATNIFYLSGGAAEFKRYLNTHTSLILRAEKGFKEAHRCSG